jgi:hypothetical protein
MAKVVPPCIKPKIPTTRVNPMNLTSCKRPSQRRLWERKLEANMMKSVTIQAPITRVSVKASGV